jgi:hypothetical protein
MGFPDFQDRRGVARRWRSIGWTLDEESGMPIRYD